MKKIITVLMICCVTLVAPAKADTSVGIVTFTVDSINRDFSEHRFPVFVKYELPGTLYAQTQPIGLAPWDMTWDDVRAIASHGWEIGAHSYSHIHPLTQADDELLDLELGAPAAHIYREIGIYPATFATPFGDYDERVLERTKVYYDAHLKAWGNDGFNDLSALDHFRINRVEVMYNQRAVEVCANIAKAGRNGQWLVLMLHGIVDSAPNEYEIAMSAFEDILECTAAMRDQGIVRVMTAADVLQEVPHTPQ